MSDVIPRIREALAAAIKKKVGQDMQVTPYALNNPAGLSVYVMPPRVNYDDDFGGGCVFTFAVEAFITANLDESSQRTLDQLLEPHGPKSVYEALMADPELGGLVQTVKCSETTDPQTVVTPNNTPGLVARWLVEVHI